jgi:anti-sigma factor RsiW
MRTCNAFDKYRDGELNAADRKEFERHLDSCRECREKASLLNNVVRVLKQEEIRPLDLADRVARQAFSSRPSWDSLVASYLRPGPAFAFLTLMLVLFSFLWIMPQNQSISAYTEYQQLLDEAEVISLDASISKVNNDSELVLWLEQEGHSQ